MKPHDFDPLRDYLPPTSDAEIALTLVVLVLALVFIVWDSRPR